MIILMKVFGPMTEQWSEILCIIIVATITIANLFAIRQNNLKRFMAFSSISQAGYIMLAVLVGTPQGMASLFGILYSSIHCRQSRRIRCHQYH